MPSIALGKPDLFPADANIPLPGGTKGRAERSVEEAGRGELA